MNIAIDFDNTFTSDPELFKSFIDLCEARGHKCYIVTMRSGRGDSKKEVEEAIQGKCQIIFCNHTFKRKVTSQLGIFFQIWVDDLPAGIDDQRLMLCYNEKGTPQTVWEWLDRRVER